MIILNHHPTIKLILYFIQFDYCWLRQ